jgi:hypothetical protein
MTKVKDLIMAVISFALMMIIAPIAWALGEEGFVRIKDYFERRKEASRKIKQQMEKDAAEEV